MGSKDPVHVIYFSSKLKSQYEYYMSVYDCKCGK